MSHIQGGPTITERQYRALKEAMQRVIEAWRDKTGLTERELRQRIRSKWGVENERELLQTEFYAVAEYLNRWLTFGCDEGVKGGKRVKLLRRIHELRRRLGWNLSTLKEFMKLRVGRSNLSSMSEGELSSLISSLEALCGSEQ
ncbi:MAG: hypothetical protein GDYSWBUE_000944 [Candidatus Fervidibacterota bacterium]